MANESSKWIADFLDAAKELRAVLGDKRFEYMPLHIDAYFGDDNVQAMSCEQNGAYLRLLMRGWKQYPPASVPNEDSRLSAWAGLSSSRWAKMRDIVTRPFDIGPDGRLYQKRLAREWLNTARNYAAKSAGGRKSGETRRSAKTLQSDFEVCSNTHDGTSNIEPNPTQPNPTQRIELNPTQPNASDGTNGEGGDDVGLGVVVGGLGGGANGNLARTLVQSLSVHKPTNDEADRAFERMGAVKSALIEAGVSVEKAQVLMRRTDITLALIKSEIASIKKSKKPVKDEAGCLVSRLER